MDPTHETAYLAAARDAEAAILALARARIKAQEVVDEAANAGSAQELANAVGMVFFDRACVQSAGAKGLESLFNRPDRIAQVGVRAGGNVEDIMRERLGSPLSAEKRKAMAQPAEQGRIREKIGVETPR